jgi:hypothetical protein
MASSLEVGSKAIAGGAIRARHTTAWRAADPTRLLVIVLAVVLGLMARPSGSRG